ncbi:mannitol-specific PTS transporter subunit IIC [Frigoribacterium sp. 2-23]|uniref:mannitol-specific PTS transporter subunit IIC n=1 Tax=Frigoribacterium sp. 2-23 TaxID=3415006 RepID=UPI003C6F19D5
MSEFTPAVTGTGARARVQRFGGFLAGMVMPNIGAFIAWGLITALFIPTGWTPNATIALIVGPMITFLLPILIAYTGGRMVHGQRGAVIAAIAVMGVVVATDKPQFLGAMIVGPIAALLLKQFDKLIDGRIKSGFEMLVNNFSLGIFGGAFAIGAFFGIAPITTALTNALGGAVDFLVERGLLPLASIIIEPAKILFLNNAINQGILTPLGAAQAQDAGKSILFMLESNPGPGLGILLAFLFFGPRAIRPSAPAAIIVQFFGGIHEIYFPYVLMKPILVLGAIAGGATGIAWFSLTHVGLVASPSPGSIIAYAAVSARGDFPVILVGILLSAAVSFVVSSLLMGFGRREKREADLEDADAQKAALADAQAATASNKATSKGTNVGTPSSTN